MEPRHPVPPVSWPAQRPPGPHRLWIPLLAGLLFVLLAGIPSPRAASLNALGHWPSYGRGEAQRVVLAEHHAFIAVGSGGLLICDVSDPAHPIPVGSWATPEPVNDLVVTNGLAYLALRWQGLQIVDVKSPANPRLVGSRFAGNGLVNGVGVTGNLALVTRIETSGDQMMGLVILDVSRPEAPTEVGRLPLPRFSGVAARDGWAYVSGYESFRDNGVDVIDLRNPSAPVRVQTFSANAPVTRVALDGSRAYVSTSAGLEILGLTTPDAPVRLASLPAPGSRSVQTAGPNRVGLARGTNGVEIIDVTAPQTPIPLGRYSDGSELTDIAFAGEKAVAVGPLRGCLTLDLSNPVRPDRIGSLRLTGFTRSVRVVGSLAYVCEDSGGFRILDVANPSRILPVAEVPDAPAMDCAISGSQAYVAAGTEGLQVIDIRDPGRPGRIGGFALQEPMTTAWKVVASGNHVYLGTGTILPAPQVYREDLLIFDVRNPAQPVLVNQLPGTPASRDMKLADGFLHTLGRIFDLANPVNPAAFAWPGDVPAEFQIVLNGRYGYVPTQGGFVYLLDLQDPRRPLGLGYTQPVRGAVRLTVEGRYGCLSGPGSELHLLDFTDPLKPRPIQQTNALGTASELVVSRGRLYAALGAQGLQVFDFESDTNRPPTNPPLELRITGPDSLPAGTGPEDRSTPTAVVTYEDGYLRDVTETARWEILETTVPATYFEGWKLRTGITAEGGTARIRARWTEDDLEWIAEKVIRIEAISGFPTNLSHEPTPVRPGRLVDAFPPDSEGSEPDPNFTFHSPEREAGLLVLIHDLCGSTDLTWPRKLAAAIARERESAGKPVPMIAFYDWREDAAPPEIPRSAKDQRSACERREFHFHLATRNFRTLALTHGQQLASLLWSHQQSGELPRNVPIHLIGHGLGGLIASEAATLLKIFEPSPVRIDQVTTLDTLQPARRHHDAFTTSDGGRLERYVAGNAAQFAPKLDGPRPDWLTSFTSIHALEGLPGVAWNTDLDLVPLPRITDHSRYLHRNVSDFVAEEHESNEAHQDIPNWYLATVTTGWTNLGYALSPWRGLEFPIAPGDLSQAGLPPFEQPVSVPLPPPDASAALPQPGGGFQLREGTHTQLVFRQLALPVGTESLRFRFRFTTPGDGESLRITWGTNRVLGWGLESPLSRAGWIPLELPLAPLAGKTNDLKFTLIGHDAPNSAIDLDGFQLTVSPDPDLDTLTTTEEGELHTDPNQADTDGDGLLDGAETGPHPTDPRNPDTDGDGAADGIEMQAGTSPTDPTSVLHLRVSRPDPATWQFRWQGSIRRLERLMSSDTLPPRVLRTVASGLGGSDQEVRFTLPASAASTRFYWIESTPR